MIYQNPNSKELIIREARHAELTDILNLYKDLNENDIPLLDESAANQIWDCICHNPRLKCFVVVYKDQIVSTCYLIIIPNLTRGARPFGLIENVVTVKTHRSKGFGTALLKFVLNFAWEQNCYKVMLLTGTKQEKKLIFYEGAGFKRNVKTGFVAYPS